MSETINIYNESAHIYEKRWAEYLEHTHSEFLKRIDFSDTDHLLDLSCGTGLLAREILGDGRTFNRLALNDPAEEMLNIAKDRFSSYPGVSFSKAPAHDLPFANNSFDRIFSLNAFHNYRHQETVIAEMCRLLKPGGHVYLQDWDSSGSFRLLNTFIRWWVSEHIETRSLEEVRRILEKQNFLIEHKRSWRYRYWKFFFVEAKLNHDF